MKIVKIGLAVISAGALLALVGCADETSAPAPAAAPTAQTAPAKDTNTTYNSKLGKTSTKKDTKK